jgi:predicted peptidase
LAAVSLKVVDGPKRPIASTATTIARVLPDGIRILAAVTV